MKHVFSMAAIAMTLAALSACMSAGGSSPAPAIRSAANASHGVRPATAQRLYVGSELGVSEYDTSTYQLVRSINRSDGATDAESLAVDASGTLYVGNYNYNSVVAYAPGATTPSETITAGVSAPVALTIDSSGNLYVANRGLGNSVTVYAPRSTRVLRTITAGIDMPQDVALNKSGDLYVSNLGNSTVTLYKSGKTKPMRTIPTDFPGPLVFDTSGNLYVGNCPFHECREAVSVFDPQGTKLLRTISKGVRFPLSLALDSSQNLYVANFDTGRASKRCQVTVYAPNATSPSRKITDGIHAPIAVAIDSADNVYVADYNGRCNGGPRGSVSVYAARSLTLQYKFTDDISRPFALAIGP